MPIGTGIIYNVGDLILSQVSGSGTSFLETKIAAATSSIVYFDNTARINSASLNSITVGTASYVSGSTSIITNLTASNISASGTSSFGYVGIGTVNPSYKLDVQPTSSTVRFGQSVVGALPVNTVYAFFGHNSLDHASTANNYALLQFSDGTTYLNASSGKTLNFRIANADKMVLDASGKLGIGTTAPLTGYLDVRSNQTKSVAGSTNIAFFGSSDAANPLGLGINHESSSGIKMVGLVGTEYGVSGNNIKINEILHVQYAGNVGIATTSPAYKLDVIGPATSNGVTLRLSDAASLANSRHILLTRGSVSGSIGIAGSQIEDPLWLSRSSGYDLIVASSGNVGVGTSIPGALLEVSSSTAASLLNVKGAGGNAILFVSGSGNVGIGTSVPGTLFQVFKAANGNNWSWFNGNVGANLPTGFTTGVAIGSNYSNGFSEANLIWGHGVSSNQYFAIAKISGSTSYSEQLRIDINGNVGIGTTVPGALLHVYGATPTIRVQGSSAASAKVDLVGTYTTWSLENQYVNGANNDMFRIYNSALSADAITINRATNNVGIGATNPAYLLDVSGSSRHGYRAADTHQFTGSVSVSGSVTAASFTGSLSGSITSALTASYLTPANSYTITNLTASNISASLTGSFGMVGIGTTSPAQKLDVAGSAYAYNYFTLLTAATYGPSDNSAAMQVFGSTGSDGLTNTIKFVTGGSERWRITDAGILQSPAGQTIQTSTGNLTLATGGGDGNILLSPNGIGKVGIGTTVPTAFVDIQGANVLSFGGSNTGSLGTIFLAGTDEYNSGTAGAGIYFRGKFNSAGTTRTTFGAISGIKENNTDGDFSGALTFFARSGSNTGIIHERMRIGSSGNVGIGTTNPVATLQVAGNVSGSSFTSSISNAVGFLGTSSWAQNVVSASFATTAQTANALNTGNSYTITNLTASNISASLTGSFGIVGIGTTSPGYKLDVNGVTRFQGIVRFKNDAWNLTDDAQARFYFDTSGRTYFGSGNGYEWRSQADSAIMTLLNNGNVGIGTTSPLERITFGSSDSIIARSSATDFNSGYCSRILFNQGGTGYGYLGFYTYQGGTGGGERMRIAENGNVGIGTTAPAAKLEISGSSNSVLLNIKSPISGAILYVSGSGAVGIGTSNVGAYTLQVSGSFAATTKSFVIEHPTKAGKKLIYGSLESPYHGIRLTGRDTLVNGKSKIQLPDYIYKLILHDSVNIQLTGIKCNKTLYIDDINVPENYFTIAYDKAIFESYKDYEFFWDFTAIRADVPELQTEM